MSSAPRVERRCGCVEHAARRRAYEVGVADGQVRVLATMAKSLRARGDDDGARTLEEMIGVRRPN